MNKGSSMATMCAGLVCTVILGAAGPSLAQNNGESSPEHGQLVISQIYLGGGQPGATYKNGFIELFNRGTAAVDPDGIAFEYGAGTNSIATVGFFAPPGQGTFRMEPGQYKLIKLAATGNFGADLPQPDLAAGVDLEGPSGKLALLTPAQGVSGPDLCPTTDPRLDDLIGFGSIDCFEGSGPTPALTLTTAAIRRNGGCTDTDDNSSDFVIGTPVPHNSSSPFQPCSDSAGNVAVSGKVVGADGRGLRSATVTLVDQNNVARSVLTSSLGFYSFDNVPAGQTYTVKVTSKRYRFAPQHITPAADSSANFTGVE